MSWIADQVANRTYDPDSGLELFFVSGSSDGSKSLEIRGEGYGLSFTASLVDAPITDAERKRLGVADAGVWRVHGKRNTEQEQVIVAALCATKMGHGFTIRREPYFVRFEANGELYGE